MDALVSIIVPVYNVEKYLVRCLDSLIRQTYSNLEIIIIDDGSFDSSGSICDQYVAKDDRIRVVHKENSGVGFARNSGLDICSGDFVMFVDSDDFISEDAVKVLYNRIMIDDSDIAAGKHVDFFEDGRENDSFCSWMQDEVMKTRDVLLSMNKSQFIPVAPWGKLYKSEIFKEIRYCGFDCGEDLMLYPQILDKCKKVSVVNKTIYYYFQRNNSLYHKQSKKGQINCIEAAINFSKYLGQKRLEQVASTWYLSAINMIYKLKDRKMGVDMLRKYYDWPMEKRLLKGRGLKQRVKRCILCIPLLYEVVSWVKVDLMGR